VLARTSTASTQIHLDEILSKNPLRSFTTTRTAFPTAFPKLLSRCGFPRVGQDPFTLHTLVPDFIAHEHQHGRDRVDAFSAVRDRDGTLIPDDVASARSSLWVVTHGGHIITIENA